FLLTSAKRVNADTLHVAEYRARLVQIRALVSNSRTASTPDRDRMLAQAAALLRQTTSLSVRGATVTVDDGAVAEVLAGPDGANRALAVLDLEIASAGRIVARSIDPSVVDARLREVVGANETSGASASWLDALFAYIGSQLAAFFSGIRGGVPDLRFLPYVLVLFGLGLIALIVAILGRGTRERLRSGSLREAAATGPPALLRRARALRRCSRPDGDHVESERRPIPFGVGVRPGTRRRRGTPEVLRRDGYLDRDRAG